MNNQEAIGALSKFLCAAHRIDEADRELQQSLMNLAIGEFEETLTQMTLDQVACVSIALSSVFVAASQAANQYESMSTLARISLVMPSLRASMAVMRSLHNWVDMSDEMYHSCGELTKKMWMEKIRPAMLKQLRAERTPIASQSTRAENWHRRRSETRTQPERSWGVWRDVRIMRE